MRRDRDREIHDPELSVFVSFLDKLCTVNEKSNSLFSPLHPYWHHTLASPSLFP